jgi:hypothetical protein
MRAPASPDRRFWWALALICCGAAALRFGYVAAAKPNQELLGDQIYYSSQARTIAEGHWFDEPLQAGRPAADHPPLTALVMAPAAAVAPGSVMAQRYLMAAYGVVVVALIGLLGRKVADWRVGLIAALIAALYPGLWVNDALVMSETVTAATLALAMLASYRFADRATLRRAAEMGLATGLAVLARAELVLLIPMVIVPLAWWAHGAGEPLEGAEGAEGAESAEGADVGVGARATPRARLALGAMAVAAALVVQAPWIAYNLTRFDQPVLFSTNDGLTWVGANCADSYYGGGVGFWSLNCGLAGLESAPPEADQSVRSAHLRSLGNAYLADHLGRLPVVVAARLGRGLGVWHPDQMVYLNRGEGREGTVSWLAIYAYWALTPLAVVGAVILRRRRTMVWPLVALVAISVMVIAAFYGIARFRLPAELAIVVLAAVTLASAAEVLRSRLAVRGATRSPPVAARPS